MLERDEKAFGKNVRKKVINIDYCDICDDTRKGYHLALSSQQYTNGANRQDGDKVIKCWKERKALLRARSDFQQDNQALLSFVEEPTPTQGASSKVDRRRRT